MNLEINLFHLINNRYIITHCIKLNRRSRIYQVTDNDGKKRAAKFVSEQDKEVLENESRVMLKSQGHRFFGTIYWYYFGRHGANYVLVMDLLGNSVSDVLKDYDKLSVKTVLRLGIQCTIRLQKLHNRGYIHGNVEPQNLVLGRSGGDLEQLYIIDYGLSSRYLEVNNEHVPKEFMLGFCDDSLFASTEAHNGLRQSRRSDLESLAYCLLYLMRGCLPWESRSLEDIRKMKEKITKNENDAIFSNIPEQIYQYFNYVKEMDYTARPDYEKLSSYLESAVSEVGEEDTSMYEWVNLA